MKRLIHRMDQTARISLQLPAMSKSVRDKIDWMRPNQPARPASSSLGVACVSSANRTRLRVPPPRLAPRQRLSAAGEGVFTDRPRPPQVLFSGKSQIPRTTHNTPQNMGFRASFDTKTPDDAQLPSTTTTQNPQTKGGRQTGSRQTARIPQKPTQTSPQRGPSGATGRRESGSSAGGRRRIPRPGAAASSASAATRRSWCRSG